MLKRNLSNFISILSFLACFAYIYSDEDLKSKFYNAIVTIEYTDFLIALFGSFIFFNLVFNRFYVLTKSNKFSLKSSVNFRIQSRSHFIGSVLPSGIGVDFFRLYFLSSRTDIPTSDIIRLIITDRILSVFLLVISSTPFLVLFMYEAFSFILILSLSIIFSITVYFFRSRILGLISLLKLPSLNSKVIFWYLSSNILIIIFATTCCLLVSNSINIDLLTLLSVIPFILFVSFIPVSLGGWGSRELTFYYFLPISGISGEESLQISIILGLLYIISPFILSLFSLFIKNEEE